MSIPTFRSRYNAPANKKKNTLNFKNSKSRTHQSFKKECDINNIVKLATAQGGLPAATRNPAYGDFTGVVDYQTALNIVQDAQRQFQQLPAIVRDRFGNAPDQFINFVTNPANSEELVKMGLATKRASESAPAPKEPTKKGSKKSSAPVEEAQSED